MGDAPRRALSLSHLSIGVACLSLGTAMYQGWLQTRNMETVTNDIARREHIRGCKDVIEAYFEAKLRIGLLADAASAGAVSPLAAPAERAAVAVSRLGAIGTFLANVEGEEARGRYTELTRELERATATARGGEAADRGALFSHADRLFAGMNEDCTASARLLAR